MTTERPPTPYSIRIRDCIAAIDWIGTPTPETTKQMIRDVLDHPRFQPGLALIVADDRSTSEEVVRVAAQLAAQGDLLGPIALLVERENHYGIGRLLGVYSGMSGAKVEVFFSVQSAFSWLRNEMAA